MPTEHRVFTWLASGVVVSLALGAGCTDDPAGPPTIVTTADRVDLGDIGCGTSRTTPVKVYNMGGQPLELAAASTLAGVTITPDHATIAPAGLVELSIEAAVPAVAEPGFTSTGDLLLTGNAESLTLPITLRSTGTVIVLDHPTVDFGQLLPGDAVQRTVRVTAQGTAPATVRFGAVSNPAFEVLGGAQTAMLVPNLPALLFVTLHAGTTPGTHDGAVPLTVSGPLCGPAPEQLTLTGIATTDVIALDHTAIDFGDVLCGTSGLVEVAIANHGELATDYAVVPSDPLHWIQAAPETGLLEPGATDTIALGHPGFETTALPPGPFVGLVDIRLNGGTSVKTLPVRAQIRRVVVAPSTTDLDLGTVAAGATVTRTFQIRNTGNLATSISLFSNAGGVAFSPQSFQLVANSAQPITVTFTSQSPGPFTSDLSFNAAGSCQPQMTVAVRGRVL
jgi:hypothetical protein